MPPLHIYDRRERALVTAADRLLGLAASAARPFRTRRVPSAPRRILLLRLERIGDLLMALPAIADVHALAPEAEIDLVVGSWNADVARALAHVAHVRTLDAAWLSREGEGLAMPALVREARRWRDTRYDLAINFEPDLRSNLLAAASGASWTAGYRSGGGGSLLDVALEYDTRSHTTDNARRLVAEVFGRPPAAEGAATTYPTLVVPAAAREAGARLLDGPRGRLVGIHVSGGRAIKQWDPERFADVAQRLVASSGVTIVLTGAATDRGLTDRVRTSLPASSVVDVVGRADLLTLAGVLERLDLLITGDTGPMHLAAAVGTPVVAVFGPSDPVRYAPRGPHDRIVRIDLPCSPCNRIRRPPARCVGHTPDCLAFLSADRVVSAANAVLDERARPDAARASTA